MPPHSHLLFCIWELGAELASSQRQLLIPKSIESEHVANVLFNLHRKEETRNYYSGVTEYKNKMLLVHWESTSNNLCVPVCVCEALLRF